jgi:hypothetical protein
MAAAKSLPPEARRAAWDALWRMLLAPPAREETVAHPLEDGGPATHHRNMDGVEDHR